VDLTKLEEVLVITESPFQEGKEKKRSKTPEKAEKQR
jgi:hypothetical protein